LTRRRRLGLAGGAVLVAVVLGIIFLHGPLLRAGIGAAGHLAGYDVRYGSLTNRDGRLVVTEPVVAVPGREPVFRADRLGVSYDLRHVFGGPYLFGVTALDLERPRITVEHRRDGSYNFVLPKSNGSTSNAAPSIPKIDVTIRDGSAGIVDQTRIFAHSRRLDVGGLRVDAALDPSRISRFSLAFALTETGGTFPVTGRGTLDERRGYELSRITVRTLALAPLIDYALNSTSLHVAGGVLNDLDARIYGLPDAHGAMQRHVSVTANLDHFQPYLNGIAKPLRDGRGALRIYDDGLAIPKVDGSIADVPVRISGAIYDLAKPKLRLGIVGRGDLHDLVTLNDAAEKLPVTGPVAFTLFVEGDATAPTTLASFSSARLAYGRIPIDAPSGLIALHGQDTSILRTSLAYDGATLGARGNLHVESKHTGVDILAHADAPLAHFPYVGTVVGPMTLHASAILAGIDAGMRATGVLDGATPTTRLGSTFSVGRNGEGTIGPVALDGPGPRSLYARVVLDRPNLSGGAAFVSARQFSFTTAGAQPALPGLTLAAVPVISGTLEANVAAAFAGNRYTAGGSAHAYGIDAFGYPVDDVTARLAATQGTHVAVDLRYRGALAPIARAAGGKITATGSADIPIAIVVNGPHDIFAQIHDVRFDGATVAGIALDGLEASARARGSTIDLYGAQATLDGHDLVAQGSFGNGGTIAVSTGALELASLRRLGLPVRSGDVTAVADIGGSASSPHVEGGVVASTVRLAAPQAAGLPIDASTGLTYDAGTLSVHDALVRAGPAVGSLDGSVSGLRGRPSDATYAFDARVRQADIATLATIAHATSTYPEGSLDADVAVRGTGSAPHISGRVAVPEGSLNGLRFRDAAVDLAGDATALRARDGRVTVGSSTLGFDAAVAKNAQAVALRAPRIDLADFNDYFDGGDTLGGRGSIAFSARNEPDRFVTDGRVRLAHTRFRRFDVGTSRADWSTSGRLVSTDLAVGGAAGTITESGTVALPASQPLRDALRRTSLALAVRAAGVNLETWLPVLDIQAPVGGVASANATIRGSYPFVVVGAHADVANGRVGTIPIRTATLDARAANGRATVTNAVLAIDNLRATLTGSAGLQPSAPLDFTLAAQTPDVGALAKTLTAKTYDVSGTLAATARLTGNASRPQLAGTLDAGQVRYAKYTVPRVHAELGATRTALDLRTAEVDFASGRLVASGHAPIQSVPTLHLGPSTAPAAFDLRAERVDFAQFAALLPKGTRLDGSLDGRVGLTGTLARPGLAGTLAVGNGSFVGPQEKSKISNLVAALTFHDRSATLHDTSATVGGGTISANGILTVPSLTNPAASANGSLTLDSKNAVFDIPSLFKGRIDGSVTVARAAGATTDVTGTLAVTSARIPTTALLPKGSGTASAAAPPPVALNLTVDVGNDVRVQGGPVDIGAKGDLTVGGSIASPTVLGELDSTGGTLSFYRTFQIQYPTTVSFDGTGVIPNVDALATTTIDNPPTDVTLHVTGPATQLNVAFESQPNYSREQIVGILVGAQALGAVSGIPTTPGAQAPQQNPLAAAAEGQLGTLLTQNILEPFSSQLGGAVGLNNLAINYTPGGGASVGAQKKIFKNVNAVFAESFNYPQRQSLGLLVSPNAATAAQLTFFSQPQSNRFDTFEGVQSLDSTNNSVTDTEPASGSSGFSFSLQRKF
jgi:autotransporter translocation and assembly factor TamB